MKFCGTLIVTGKRFLLTFEQNMSIQRSHTTHFFSRSPSAFSVIKHFYRCCLGTKESSILTTFFLTIYGCINKSSALFVYRKYNDIMQPVMFPTTWLQFKCMGVWTEQYLHFTVGLFYLEKYIFKFSFISFFMKAPALSKDAAYYSIYHCD